MHTQTQSMLLYEDSYLYLVDNIYKLLHLAYTFRMRFTFTTHTHTLHEMTNLAFGLTFTILYRPLTNILIHSMA